MTDLVIPGDVDGLEQLALGLQWAGGHVQDLALQVAGCEETSWTGSAAEAYHALLSGIPTDFHRAADGLLAGGNAIAAFASDLSALQAKAARLQAEIEASEDALTRANARKVDAERALADALKSAAADGLGGLGAGKVLVDAAKDAVDVVSAEVGAHASDLGSLNSQAASNLTAYNDAVRTCIARLAANMDGVGSHGAVGTSSVVVHSVAAAAISGLAADVSANLSQKGYKQAPPPESPQATAAVTWAKNQLSAQNKTGYVGLCLPFVEAAYKADKAGGVTLRDHVAGMPGGWTDDTYPDNVWPYLTGGTKGSPGTTPPVGALVFFAAGPGGDAGIYKSHVEIYVGGGQCISTEDGWGKQNGFGNDIHYEPYGAVPAGPHGDELGWWLPPS